MGALKKINEIAGSLLSDAGTLSTKLLFGSALMIMYIGCTTYSTIVYGINPSTEHLLEYGLIGGCAMLGINSVVSIFRPGSKYSHRKLTDDE